MGQATPRKASRGLRYGAPLLLLLVALSARADERQVNRLQTLTVTEGAKATEIVVTGSAPPTFTVFKLNKPTRLFVDVSNADISAISGPIEVENGVISQITPLQFTDELVRIGRIVVGLEVNALYSVRADGNQLVITVDASQRKQPAVAGNDAVSSEAIAAAKSRQQDAERRAQLAEARAQAAEAKAKEAAKSADDRVAQAQAKARNAEASARAAEATALRAAETAQKQADTAEGRAAQAEARAETLATAAAKAQSRVKSATKAIQTEAAQEAQRLREQAKASNAMAKAARAEAIAAQDTANARAAAAQAQTAAADARATAAENQADKTRAQADLLAKRAQTEAAKAEATQAALDAARSRLAQAEKRAKAAERAARAAEVRTQTAEQETKQAQAEAQTAQSRIKTAQEDAVSAREQLRAARAQVRDLSRSTSGRIERAEARAKAAEARVKTAEKRAEVAQTQAAQAESRARIAEVSALKAAETSRRAAQDADRRAQSAEKKARQLANAADTARRTAMSARSSARTDANRIANEAKAKAETAQAQAEAARLSANTAAQTAQARMAAAEARAQEATARAQAAEAQLKASQELSTQRAVEAESLATKAEAAERRATEAQANLDTVNTQLAQARVKIERAEANATSARARLTAAQKSLNNAKTEAEKERARARLAESQIASAKSETRAASERAYAAEQRAQTARMAAENSTKLAENLRRTATTGSDRTAANQAEAEARIALAEAKARRLEAERARLAEQLGSLETERAQARAELNRIRSDRTRLDAQLAQARAQNNRSQARLLKLERVAQDAQASANLANLARIDSARAASELAQRMKTLETNIAAAERNQKDAELANLNVELASAKQKAKALSSALAQKKSALARAEATAKQSTGEVQRLRASMSETVAKTSENTPNTVKSVALPALPPQMRTRITNVKFQDQDRSSQIIVEHRGELQYTLKTEGARTRILEIKNALIEPALERSLDTSEFGSAVQLVSSFQSPPPGDRVRIVVTLSEQVPAKLTRSGSTLVWHFERPVRSIPTVAGLPPAPTWTPPVAEVKYEQPRAAVFTGMNQAIATRSIGKPRPVRRKRYSGRKINIDIKDGDIHNILRLLAKEGNVNIVTSDEVTGAITMHLKLVPWDQALEIILRTKGLDMVREGDIIRVAPSESIAKERESELKKQEVQEKLKPLEVKLITVNHAAAGDLMPRVQSVLSKRGTSQFDARTNTVILKDVDDHLDAAEDLIRRLDTQTPQVLIETRIVEVNEVNIQQLGIQWGVDSTWSAAAGNPTGLRFPSSVGISGGADDQQGSTEGVSSNPNYVVNLPAASGLGSGGALGMTFGSIDSTFNLNVRLSALENRGSVKIVSSPKITTLDNKTAEISQGVSIPISQISASGIQTVFFDAVLLLEATPHVTQDGNIYLKLRAQNNTPDFQNVGARGDPTILKKEAKTELLLKDGDTTVIGGIYTSNAGFNRSEVPFLARIPILGALFRNYQESDRRSELLIFVTPRIVNRAASTVKTAQ